MSHAPERIGLISDGMGRWALATVQEADVAVHYIRKDAALALPEIAVLREAMQRARDELINVQPHIPQGCIAGHAPFIGCHIDAAMEALSSALAIVEGTK